LRKRQNYKHDGEALNGFVLTMIVVHLMNIKRVNTSMSSYQIIKVVLQFLCKCAGFVLCVNTNSLTATSDILTNGLFMNTSLHGDAKEVPSDVASVKQQFLSSFDVVFLDPSSRLNLTARVSKYAMLEVSSVQLYDTSH
jgi:16S rRNA G966 N2-methylase RsmD